MMPAERAIRLSAARHFLCSAVIVGNSFDVGGRYRPAGGGERERDRQEHKRILKSARSHYVRKYRTFPAFICWPVFGCIEGFRVCEPAEAAHSSKY